MPTDIRIDLKSHARPLGTAARALGSAGVNIDGLSGPSTVDDETVGHLLVEDPEAATRVLEEAGVRVVGQQEVLVVEIADRPGALAELYEQVELASVDFAYLTTRGKIVIGLDPETLRTARRTLGLD